MKKLQPRGRRERVAGVLATYFLLAAASLHAADEDLDPAAAEQRGFDHLFGVGMPVDYASARGWFGQAAAAGRPVSRQILAELYWKGLGGPPDEARALALYRAAAGQGMAQAQAFLGWAYLSGTAVEQDDRAARTWLTAAARQGEPWAIDMLGVLYRESTEVPRDAELSFALLERAAELHRPAAVHDLAATLLDTTSEKYDPVKGVFVLRDAAPEDPTSAILLAFEYLRGTNVPRDPRAAFRWVTGAAEAGDDMGGLWEAEFIAKGIGTPRDEALARKKRNRVLVDTPLFVLNNFCWMLATGDVDELRDGARAASMMEWVLADPTDQKAGWLDTLAAAYAEQGEFERAVQTQRAAIAALPAGAVDDGPAFDERLSLYRAGKPYRTPL